MTPRQFAFGLLAGLFVTAGCIGQPPVPVTRGDLALALIEFEKALAENPITPGGAAAVNREFDRASLAFFSGSLAEVIRQLADLRLRLDGPEIAPIDRVAASLKARVEPPVWVPGSKVRPTARITHMTEAAAPSGDLALTFRIRSASGEVKFERNFTVQGGPITRVDQTISIEPDSELGIGQYVLEVGGRGAKSIAAGRWTIAARSLDATRRENDDRLDSIKASAPANLAQAIANCRGRNALLTDRPSDDVLAEFLADARSISSAVAAELKELEEGRNPYRRQAGDQWRQLKLMGSGVSCRVFAPPAATGDTAVPLIIALHGAGGDENMFMDAYGRGLIKTLAEKHGFLVASPSTYSFLMNPALADELVTAMSRDYSVDSSRIYVLGHSLGAMAASRIARERPRLAAAVCCVSGGDFSGAKRTCPALVIGGGLDPVSNARDLQRRAAGATAAGLPVEYRQLDDYGHTLIVDKILPDAVTWLLDRRLDANSGKARPGTKRAGVKGTKPASTSAPAIP